MSNFSEQHTKNQLYASVSIDGKKAAMPEYATGRPKLSHESILNEVRDRLIRAELAGCVTMGEGRVFLVPLADPKATLEKATEFIHGNIGDDLPLIVGTVEYQES